MKSFVFSFFLVCHIWVSGQNFWEIIPAPFPNSMLSVCARDNYIYIGTLGGLYISGNDGHTWDFVQIDQYNFVPFFKIEVSASGAIYTGSDYYAGHDALFKSVDHGQSWQSILSGMEELDGVIVSIHCVNDDTIYVGMTNTPVLIRSNDGGTSWNVIFTCESTNSFISGVAINSSGDIYISKRGEFEQQGGVYLSQDQGETWQFLGLSNQMVSSIAIDSNDDVYVSSWGGHSWDDLGIYVLRHNSVDWEKLLDIQSADLVINEVDYIYATSSMPEGVFRSMDHGVTFEYLTAGFPGGQGLDIALDETGYVYNCTDATLIRSVNSTVKINSINREYSLFVYPNPSTGQYYFNSDFFYVNDEILIYNSYGEVVERIMLTNENKVVNLDHLDSGIYFAKSLYFPTMYKIVKL